ncbi:MAG: efflux RND transporter periplasmic adaptor subunit [Sphingobacteriales bacterium]|nr:efflux RND transporter periplasmic adaptor subunit [Sphingobacteriales bacterium]
MEKMWKDNLPFAFCFLLFASLMTACHSNADKKSTQQEHIQYTCSMHPQVIEDHPGTCPICGMNLVPLQHKSIHLQVDAALTDLIQPTNKTVISNINTIHPQELSIMDTILMDGKISYDTERINTQSAQFSGRIERLFVKYNFQKVTKGQKLMEIYSPDLAAAQQELLYVKTQQDDHLLQLAKTRLRLLGMTDSGINQILKSGTVNYKIPVYSNYSGYVIDPEIEKSISNRGLDGTESKQKAISFLEGDYIKTGDVLFKVFNHQKVWVLAYADNSQLKQLRENQAIQIIHRKDTVSSKISLIQPYFSPQQPYGLVRITLDNAQQKFKVGDLIKAKAITKPQSGLWIPAEASYQMGNKTIVFLKKNQVLMAMEIIIGAKSGDFIQVKSGLKSNDEIAATAAYLMDSESFIQTQQ